MTLADSLRQAITENGSLLQVAAIRDTVAVEVLGQQPVLGLLGDIGRVVLGASSRDWPRRLVSLSQDRCRANRQQGPS